MKKGFFLQFARMWCKKSSETFDEIRLQTDNHAPNYMRVNEQLKHQKGFKEAYNCKDGDPMTLDDNEIISIW